MGCGRRVTRSTSWPNSGSGPPTTRRPTTTTNRIGSDDDDHDQTSTPTLAVRAAVWLLGRFNTACSAGEPCRHVFPRSRHPELPALSDPDVSAVPSRRTEHPRATGTGHRA